MRRTTAAAFVTLLILVPACGSDDASDVPPSAAKGPPAAEAENHSSAVEVDERPGILAAVALARVVDDNSFGGQDVFAHVDVVDRLGRPGGDGNVFVDDDAEPLTGPERVAIEQRLAPRTVTWVASLQAVIGDGQELPAAGEVGAVLTLAAPDIDGGRATVASQLWCGGTCGIGGTHSLERDASGTWTVTGTVGTISMA
jgi:hypothetical protein